MQFSFLRKSCRCFALSWDVTRYAGIAGGEVTGGRVLAALIVCMESLYPGCRCNERTRGYSLCWHHGDHWLFIMSCSHETHIRHLITFRSGQVRILLTWRSGSLRRNDDVHYSLTNYMQSYHSNHTNTKATHLYTKCY